MIVESPSVFLPPTKANNALSSHPHSQHPFTIHCIQA